MTESDDVRFYEMIRGRIEHEDGLIVQRLSWLVGSQSFLFTAFAISVNGLATLGPTLGGLLHVLKEILPWVGIFASGLIYVGVVAALFSMNWLRRSFEARGKTAAALGVPELLTPMPIRAPGLAAPLFLPLLFIAAWAWLQFRT